MRCISLEQLADLVEERCSDLERSVVERHLAEGCDRCQTNWLWVKRIYQLTALDSAPEPPEWLVRRAIAAFAQKRPVAKKKGLQKIIAALVFDSFYPLQPAEVRKLGEAGRQLIYKAAPYEVDLRFLPSENLRYENVIGQVLGVRPDFSDVVALKVMVYRGSRRVAVIETNEVGVFNLYNLPQGKYDLTIRFPTEEIRILEATTSGITD